MVGTASGALAVPERRRPRPGSVDRPVNGRLYRVAALTVPLALAVAAFSVSRPSALPPPALPPVYDGVSAFGLADELSRRFPDRSPGSTGSRRAAAWVASHFAELGLPAESQRFDAVLPGRGRVSLENVFAVARGRTEQAILVVAHRDNVGAGPGANHNASGTATLLELARPYAAPRVPAAAGRPILPVHTIVFLSSDGGAFGALGAARFADHRRFRDRILGAINLVGLNGSGRPRLETAGDRPRSPPPTLVQTAAARVREHAGAGLGRATAVEQLLDLAFPFTLYEQGPFVGRGIPALTLTTSGERPPPPFEDVPELLDFGRLDRLGRAAQALIGSLDQGFQLESSPSSHLHIGSRVVPGWAVMLVAGTALVPFVVAVADLLSRSRRRAVALLPAARSYGRRLAFWLAAMAFFALLALAGFWTDAEPRPLSPESDAVQDWPARELLLFAVIAAGAWLLARRRLVRRRLVSAEEELGGYTVVLVVLALVALATLAWNPFALLFVLPSLHAWLWLPQLRTRARALRVAALAAGFGGPLLLLGSLAIRFDLGFDAPWYLVQLAVVGYVSLPAVVLTLVWLAAAAQLVALVASRYAPYPAAAERATAPSIWGFATAAVREISSDGPFSRTE